MSDEGLERAGLGASSHFGLQSGHLGSSGRSSLIPLRLIVVAMNVLSSSAVEGAQFARSADELTDRLTPPSRLHSSRKLHSKE